jgi:hypothetical protein
MLAGIPKLPRQSWWYGCGGSSNGAEPKRRSAPTIARTGIPARCAKQ